MSKYVKPNNIYLVIIADPASLDAAKKYFLSKRLKVSGGITWSRGVAEFQPS